MSDLAAISEPPIIISGVTTSPGAAGGDCSDDPQKVAALLATVRRLAAMRPIEAEALVNDEARKLRIRVTALREEIRASRRRNRIEEAEAEAVDPRRSDSRLRLAAPSGDAERLPIVRAIDDLFAGLAGPEPPMRDSDGRPVDLKCRTPILLHDMTNAATNASPKGTSHEGH